MLLIPWVASWLLGPSLSTDAGQARGWGQVAASTHIEPLQLPSNVPATPRAATLQCHISDRSHIASIFNRMEIKTMGCNNIAIFEQCWKRGVGQSHINYLCEMYNSFWQH